MLDQGPRIALLQWSQASSCHAGCLQSACGCTPTSSLCHVFTETLHSKVSSCLAHPTALGWLEDLYVSTCWVHWSNLFARLKLLFKRQNSPSLKLSPPRIWAVCCFGERTAAGHFKTLARLTMFARPLVILFAESESSCRSHLILGRCFGQPLSFCSQAFFLFVNALPHNGPPNRCTCFSLTISRWLMPRPNTIKECRVESDHCHCRASLRKRPQKIHPRVSYQPVQTASLIYRSGTAFGNWPGREWFHNGCLGEPTSQDSGRPLAQSSCFSKFSFFWFRWSTWMILGFQTI